MSTVEVRPMRRRREMRRFHTFPWKIYSGDPLWVPPLLPDRTRMTDPDRGAFFKRGEAACFAAFLDDEMAGTICVAMDRHVIEQTGRREAIFGFFECVNNAAVAEALFAAADAWALERGLTSLHGPFNLDYEDGYGLLTDGRDRKPVVLCGHTPPYYIDLVEGAGFVPARPGNIALAVDLTDPPAELARLRRAGDLARRRGHVSIRNADKRRWQEEAVHVHHLLNNAIETPDSEVIAWSLDAVEGLIEPMLRIADPELVLFAERNAGPPRGGTAPPSHPVEAPTSPVVGWFAAIPNMNEITEHLRGLRFPWDYLRVPYALLRTPRCLAVKSLLVLPAYHRSAVAPLLFDEMVRRARAKGYAWADMSLTSEDNPETPILAERHGAVRYKRYQVYRRVCRGAG